MREYSRDEGNVDSVYRQPENVTKLAGRKKRKVEGAKEKRRGVKFGDRTRARGTLSRWPQWDASEFCHKGRRVRYCMVAGKQREQDLARVGDGE
jgi:hypothetical protein